jgi:hypothetical protein
MDPTLKKFLVLHASSTVLLFLLKLSKWELGNKLFGRLKKWLIPMTFVILFF